MWARTPALGGRRSRYRFFVLVLPRFERVEPPPRPGVRLREVVELPDVRFGALLRPPPLVVVLRFVVPREAPVPDRPEEPDRLDVVPLREDVRRPVVRRVVEPLRLPPLVVVLRFVVLREPPLLRDVVVFRAVAFAPVALRAVVFAAPVVLRAVVFAPVVVLRAVAFAPVVLRAVVFAAPVVLRAVVFGAPVVLRAVVFGAPVVLRAVALVPVAFVPAALRAVVVERFDVSELRDVFDAPLVFFPVDLVRANALRLPSFENPGRRATTESTQMPSAS
jgi:hypothetical protein